MLKACLTYRKNEIIIALKWFYCNYIFMRIDAVGKHSKGVAGLPESVLKSLRRSGENIRIARKKRRMPLKEMSNRTMVSIPTLRKVESGEPSVSIGIFLQVLWVLQLHSDFESITDPDKDVIGKRLEEKRLPKRVRQTKTKKDLDF